MARVKLQAGAEFDILNKTELSDALKDQSASEWASRGAGVKPLRFIIRPFASIGTAVGYALNITPNQGYVWNLRYVAASLASAQTVQFFLGTDTSTNLTATTNLAPLANSASALVGSAGFGSGQVMLQPEDFLVVYAGGTVTLNSLFVQVWEVPAELAWKLE